MKTRLPSVLFVAAVALAIASQAHAHCQVPCGIYDDSARVQQMLEDVATVEKAVKMISELAGKTDAQSQNQMVRWVTNKEDHAQRIISTISDYFLTQRVKPSQADYAERLRNHHGVILAAMQAKQKVDMSVVADLKESVEKLQPYYPEEKH